MFKRKVFCLCDKLTVQTHECFMFTVVYGPAPMLVIHGCALFNIGGQTEKRFCLYAGAKEDLSKLSSALVARREKSLVS